MPLLPHSRLGPYEIIALLGAGGMGEVYRARDSRLGRDVAIKVLPSSFSKDPDRLSRFEQEARAAAALNHPNILAVFEFGTHEGAPYLVSELLDGSTLRDHLPGAPIALRKAIDYGVQIANGLAAAHEKGIVHRDLKPENLFVTRDGRVKILDFGLAKLAQGKASAGETATQGLGTEAGVTMGTAGYMSPEQVRGEPADHRADIFAYGVVLYEMLAGERAFRKPTSAETMFAILKEDPASISQIAPATPLALQRVVQRCLEKNPQQRFQSASDLAFALEALSGSGSAAVGVAGREAPPRSWIWPAAAAAVVVASAAALAFWWRSPPAVPVVESIIQLTDDGEPKVGTHVFTDGSRVYFNEAVPRGNRIAQVAATGGQTAAIPTSNEDSTVIGVAPDGSRLLAAAIADYQAYTLLTLPLPTGAAQRVGAVVASSLNGQASFLSDGRIAYSEGNALNVAEADGSNPHKLFSYTGKVLNASLSPNGKRIVFDSGNDPWSNQGLIESDPGGSRFRQIPDTGTAVCCSSWTLDGKFLVYERADGAIRGGRVDMWAVSTQAGWFRPAPPPVRLTNGPLSFSGPTLSKDGKQIFALGIQQRGELVRYDMQSKRLVPFLSGVSAIQPTFSRDGQWVAYASYPEHTLWRSRVDGTERLQLTFPPLVATWPYLSPDGKQVQFQDQDGSSYVIGMEGGVPERVPDGQLSPDGNLRGTASMAPGTHWGQSGAWKLQITDLRTGKVSVVPSSADLVGFWWLSQDSVLSWNQDDTKFVVLDLKSQKRTELMSGVLENWFLSVDCKYLYYTNQAADPHAFRIRIADKKVETIMSMTVIRRVNDAYEGNQINVAPDGSPLFTRDVGSQEIYALNVKWP